ncbi:hypothetical protein OIE82_27025 [Streptomyces althioticus]|uniref:Uncharacterized protein n=1 Tax=Streptomyces althioticus TaxID=83380 RepID=A0ABZ1YDZ0_9ACTN
MQWIIALVMSLVFLSGITGMTNTPAPVAHHAPDTASEEHEWQEFHSLAYSEYSDEFTRIYNGLETKWSKNGRLMMRNGDSGPYKFVKRAA